MDKSQIFIYAAVIVFAGFRLYQKYGKKKAGNEGKDASSSSASFSSSSSKEDEYEPYSKR